MIREINVIRTYFVSFIRVTLSYNSWERTHFPLEIRAIPPWTRTNSIRYSYLITPSWHMIHTQHSPRVSQPVRIFIRPTLVTVSRWDLKFRQVISKAQAKLVLKL